MRQITTLVTQTIVLLLISTTASAATTHHRVVWDSDPVHNAVIAFSPNGTSTSPYIKFGYSTNETQWVSQQPTSSQNFQSGLLSYFVRLTNLTENAAVYYRVCDNNGCGDRFWFKTAPATTQPYTVIAGGDSRTGTTNRRAGNVLVSKIRPLFIMHGGDFTNANNASEMNEFLTDWALTYSADTIDGIAYKRIYPIIPTHGNHEDTNYSTLCQVFGVDYNRDNQCTTSDTYGAFNISPLLRVYTLNSQYTNSGWSAQATAMNNWLASDLSSFGSSAHWRFAQYHKPMFAHHSGKPDNPQLFSWWANHFYNYGMNLVIESDSHLHKVTRAIRPSGSSFVVNNTGGTVYTGEGSWGAPVRSADRPQAWTIDLASIQALNVISVSAENIKVRTAQFDATAATLTRTERENNPLALPANVNWWSANGIGDTMTLIKNSAGQSIIDEGVNNGSSIQLSATDDSFVASLRATQNFNGSTEGLLADGVDATYGAMESLIKWNMGSIPGCSTITGASVQIDVFNTSPDSFQIYSNTNSWSETSVTWNSAGSGNNRGSLMATFTASSLGLKTIPLSTVGVDVIKGWLQGNNNGIIIAANGGTDGIDFRSKEMSSSPALIIYYQPNPNGCGPTSTTVELSSTQDTFVSSTKNTQNFNGSSEGLLADGSDATYGTLNALLKWSTSNIPTCATISSANLQLNITNTSSGTYQVRSGVNTWAEATASWNSIGGTAHQGNVLASFTATTIGVKTIPLPSTSMNAIQSWLQGTNNGVVITSAGSTDGIDFTSREITPAPKLIVTYTCPTL